MSDLIQTVEKQAIDSELITLFDLEYADGQFAYFSPEGKDESLTDIQFRDTGGTARTYITIPAEADGFSVNSDGAYSRPEITIANALSTFKTSIGNLDYEDLIGRRITKWENSEYTHMPQQQDEHLLRTRQLKNNSRCLMPNYLKHDNVPLNAESEEAIYSEGEPFEGYPYPKNTWDSDDSLKKS